MDLKERAIAAYREAQEREEREKRHQEEEEYNIAVDALADRVRAQFGDEWEIDRGTITKGKLFNEWPVFPVYSIDGMHFRLRGNLILMESTMVLGDGVQTYKELGEVSTLEDVGRLLAKEGK